MTSGTAWEQLMGRKHRHGQLADEVRFQVYQHTDEFEGAFAQALQDAAYQQQTTGSRQKLLYATRVGC